MTTYNQLEDASQALPQKRRRSAPAYGRARVNATQRIAPANCGEERFYFLLYLTARSWAKSGAPILCAALAQRFAGAVALGFVDTDIEMLP